MARAELINRFALFLRRRFGTSVRRILLDGGFTCPNRDGTRGRAGCIFCDVEGGTGRTGRDARPISEQLTEGVGRLGRGRPELRFLAAFQSFSATYAPVARLRRLYLEALAHPAVVGLVVSTRPDCLDQPVLDLLEELAARTFVSVELGIQSLHDRTLRDIGRGHDVACVERAVRACRGRGLFTCGHFILGLPGESAEDWLASAERAAALRLDGVKLHALYGVTGTEVARRLAAGDLELPTREEFVRGAAAFLERLPWEVVVERLVSDPPADRTVGPSWLAGSKRQVTEAILHELAGRGSRQGALAAVAIGCRER